MRRKPTNALTAKDSYTLCRWLELNWDTPKVAGESMTEAAANATKDLRFTVTQGNIKGALKATGKQWRASSTSGGGLVWGKIKMLEDRVEQLEAIIEHLRESGAIL